MTDESFLALKGLDDPEDYVVCDYTFLTHQKPYDAAVDLCKSQSTASAGWGSYGAVKEESDPRVDAFKARLLSYEVLGQTTELDMPAVNPKLQSNPEGIYTRATCKMALPLRNLSPNIPILLTAAAGEIHNLDPFNSIKLTDIRFPKGYLKNFKGPNYGSSGMREFTGIKDRPLMIGVIKPSICPNEMFAELAYESFMGGLDMVKDDELLADLPDSPLAERVRLVTETKKRAEKELGRRLFYQANITGSVTDLIPNYNVAVGNGADCVMINAKAVGLSAARMLTDYASVPVASHFDMTATNAKVPFHGVSHRVWAKLHRMAGIDNVVTPAPNATQMEYAHDIQEELNIYQGKLGDLRSCTPFLGGGVKATNLKQILDGAGTTNVGLIVGHGIYAHPDGARAGARSTVQAWEAYEDGVNLKEYAKDHPELRKALEHFAGHLE